MATTPRPPLRPRSTPTSRTSAPPSNRDAPRRGPARLLLTRDHGYVLAVDPTWVDAVRFERLAAEGRRARTGEMRDIVATIQAEQDAVIRAPLAETVIVQGEPPGR